MPNRTNAAPTRHILNQNTNTLNLTACPRAATTSLCNAATSTYLIPLGLPRAEPRDCALPEGGAHGPPPAGGAGGGGGGGARGLPSPHNVVGLDARVSTPVENSSFRRSKIPQPPPGGGLQFRLM